MTLFFLFGWVLNLEAYAPNDFESMFFTDTPSLALSDTSPLDSSLPFFGVIPRYP